MPAAPPPSHPGLFVEHDSPRETPRLYVTNLENDLMTLTHMDNQGKVYQVTSSHGRTAILELPPGDYQIRVTSDDPRIEGNFGDAVFRRRKEYEAVFQHGQDAEPIHLGDE